jgi:phosphinothricin acetyltransferase
MVDSPATGKKLCMTDLNIRDARRSDFVKITEIYSWEVLTGYATFEQTPPDLSEMVDRWQGIRALELPFLVAEQGGQVLGYCYASNFRPRSAYENSIENSVYVDAAAQGQGVGRALLTALIARCEGGWRRQMIAVIATGDSARSVALHQSLGFRKAGVLQSVGYKLGRWVDTVIMQRPLNQSDSTPPRRT